MLSGGNTGQEPWAAAMPAVQANAVSTNTLATGPRFRFHDTPPKVDQGFRRMAAAAKGTSVPFVMAMYMTWRSNEPAGVRKW